MYTESLKLIKSLHLLILLSLSTVSSPNLTLFSKSFSSFLHSTCSLSVSYPYLALDDYYHPIRVAISNNPTLKISNLQRGNNEGSQKRVSMHPSFPQSPPPPFLILSSPKGTQNKQAQKRIHESSEPTSSPSQAEDPTEIGFPHPPNGTRSAYL